MKASAELGTNLQAVLVDMIDLHLQGKQAHWNIVGPNFRDLHLQLDEIIESARTFSDELAERMRALHVAPDGRSATVAKTSSLDALPEGEILTTDAVILVTERLEATSSTIRRVHDQVDEEDPTTADILHTFIEALEQYAWMVSAEDRLPGKDKPVTTKAASKSGAKK